MTSHVDVINRTSLPFNVYVVENGKRKDIGVCPSFDKRYGKTPIKMTTSKNNVVGTPSQNFGIPMTMLQSFAKDWSTSGKAKLTLQLSPSMANHQEGANAPELFGTIDIAPSMQKILDETTDEQHQPITLDLTCYPEEEGRSSSLAIKVSLQYALIVGIDNNNNNKQKDVHVRLCLEPRAVIENKLPIGIDVRTPMPYVFGTGNVVVSKSTCNDKVTSAPYYYEYKMEPGGRIEVYSPGPSISVDMKTSDNPTVGSTICWSDDDDDDVDDDDDDDDDEGFVDLPLATSSSLSKPIRRQFSCLSSYRYDKSGKVVENELDYPFFIAQGYQSLSNLVAADDDGTNAKSGHFSTLMANQSPRTFYVTIRYYGIDHSGAILFEQLPEKTQHTSRRRRRRRRLKAARTKLGLTTTKGSSSSLAPCSAFDCTTIATTAVTKEHNDGRTRLSLLPSGKTPIRIVVKDEEKTKQNDGVISWKRSAVRFFFCFWLPKKNPTSFPFFF